MHNKMIDMLTSLKEPTQSELLSELNGELTEMLAEQEISIAALRNSGVKI